MEEKGESVTGPMLCEKHKQFEELMNIPEEQRFTGDGWIYPFCKAYKIKEYQQHGEAGSVDIRAVETERAHMGKLLSTFPARDHWNFDETTLFPL